MWRVVPCQNSCLHRRRNPDCYHLHLRNWSQADRHHSHRRLIPVLLLGRPNSQSQRPRANALSRIHRQILFSVCSLARVELHSVVCCVSTRKLVRQWASCSGVDVEAAASLRWRRATSAVVKGIENPSRITTRTVTMTTIWTAMMNTTKSMGTLGSEASRPVPTKQRLRMCTFVSHRTRRAARSYFSELFGARRVWRNGSNRDDLFSSRASLRPRGSSGTGNRSVHHRTSIIQLSPHAVDMCSPRAIQTVDRCPTSRYLVGHILMSCSPLMLDSPLSWSFSLRPLHSIYCQSP